ncbi:OTU domain-containing protein 7B-like [Diaphorina citri]|uniref:ubiquitinyl hydrolase 1 n=1 Tax=Diaphorina citri TaxID=121845 RepID=A0A1S3CXX9_DIACI|nr:OTU domain-containing protein 7B-like [Diaphorina citri]
MVGTVPSSSSPIPITSPAKGTSENYPNLSSASSRSSTSSSYQNKLNADIIDYKKLNRGISRATDNEKIVSRARSEIALVDNTEETDADQLFIESPVYTFTLPDLTQYPDKKLNRGISRATDNEKIVSIWGFHDRLLTLRKALHVFLSQSPRKEALWRRWKYQQSKLNEQSGLVYSEIEWRREWNAIVSMASTVPRLRRQSLASNCTDGAGITSGAIYESLEEIHVLALAHVLRRPIIVVADTVLKDMNGEDLAPIPFGGIYLPLECPPDKCLKSPLLLAYDGGHFSALVAMHNAKNPEVAAIPLVDHNKDLLPIQFNVDPGDEGDVSSEVSSATHSAMSEETDNVNLLAEYLDVLKLDPHVQFTNTDTSDASGKGNNGLLGSLGKSVGAKLRLKLSRSNSQRSNEMKKAVPERVMCALLYTKNRTDYQDVLIENYLRTARVRFEQSIKEENILDTGPRYGTGKSQFYANSDLESHEKINALTPIDPNTHTDSTVYLCKSTFYADNTSAPLAQPESPLACQSGGCTFYANPNSRNYCSKCYQDLVLAGK